MSKAKELEKNLRSRDLLCGMFQILEGKNISILTAQMKNNDILHAVFHETEEWSKIWTDGRLMSKEEILKILGGE